MDNTLLPDKKIDRLIEASISFAEFYEKHCAYEEAKTKKLQEAANLQRQGRGNEAWNIVRKVDSEPRVFDYSKVNKEMVNAVKPFRNRRLAK